MLADPNIYFLIGGKEESINGVDHDRWIEVGWTEDLYSLIAAADIFLLPNRETYFDFVLLEVLSLGVPVVLTNVGGNNYFKKYNKIGLKYFSTIDEGVSAIHVFKNMSVQDREQAGKELADLCVSVFSVQEFARRYIQIITEIANIGE